MRAAVAVALGFGLGLTVGYPLAVDEQPPACGAIERARIIVKNLGAPAGDEELVFAGKLPVPLPPSTGLAEAQVSIDDLGAEGAAVLDLQGLRLMPGRRGRGLYLGALNSGGSGAGRGRTVLRVRGRRSRSDEVLFRMSRRGAATATPVGPLRGTIVLGAGSASSTDQRCGVYAFTASECAFDSARTTLSCRTTAAAASATPTATPPPDCMVTGCNAELCADHEVLNDCEWFPYYACSRGASCERQPDERCDWTPTEDLTRCLAETRGTPRPDPLREVIPGFWLACETDTDCTVVTGLDCCGCDTGGGPEAGINTTYLGVFTQLRSDICRNYFCSPLDLCRTNLTAVCREDQCAVTSGQ